MHKYLTMYEEAVSQIYDSATNPCWISLYMRKIRLFYQRINRSQTHESRNWDWGLTQFLYWEIFFSNFRYSVFAVQGQSQKGRVTRIRKGKMTKMPTTLWRSHTGEKDERLFFWIAYPCNGKRSKRHEAVSAVEEKPFTSSLNIFPEALCRRGGATPPPPFPADRWIFNLKGQSELWSAVTQVDKESTSAHMIYDNNIDIQQHAGFQLMFYKLRSTSFAAFFNSLFLYGFDPTVEDLCLTRKNRTGALF
jgi:hypothetical protein